MNKKGINENILDYKIRLCENKEKLNLTWSEIAKLINYETGNSFGESAYRKWYSAFNEGRNYYKKEDEKNIGSRILSISDLHIPYQLPIETFKEYINKVDVLQINGDVLDMASCSKFDKVYRESPMDEIIMAREYLTKLISYINPKKVIINYGNHDIRFERYLARNLDNDILELMPTTPLKLIFDTGFTRYNKKEGYATYYEPIKEVFKNIEIEYSDNWFCQINNILFVHPQAFSSGILKTAEKALYFFRNEGYCFDALVMAHTHRIGEYIIGNTTIYEQGCCCDVSKMQYNNGKLINSQKEGFLYICLDKNNKIIRDKTNLVLIK